MVLEINSIHFNLIFRLYKPHNYLQMLIDTTADTNADRDNN